LNIGGLQKFSLLDYPGRISAIVFTQGCNFRCPYCHNPELVDPARYTALIPEAEVMSFLTRRKGKLGAVTITGGEPTMQSELFAFISKIRALGFRIKLDTNGSSPDIIGELIKQDLVDYWAMDIKAPWDIYQIVTQSLIDPELIGRSMEIIRGSGKIFEFRTTLFDKLLTWSDIERIKSILLPGDSFYLQQCRYKHTLTDMETNEDVSITPHHLADAPESNCLVEWGRAQGIRVNLRSL